MGEINKNQKDYSKKIFDLTQNLHNKLKAKNFNEINKFDLSRRNTLLSSNRQKLPEHIEQQIQMEIEAKMRKKNHVSESQKLLSLIQNLPSKEYEMIIEKNFKEPVNFNNLNRVICLREAKKAAESVDSLYTIKLNEIKKSWDSIAQDSRYSRIAKVIPKKLIKINFHITCVYF